MDHPLRGDNYKELRKRVVSLLENGFSIQRQSNIVFVCGGNDANHMRKRFQSAFPALLPDYEYFEPEFAMTNYLSFDDPTPFDIAEFEELIGALSHSIVLFPEGAGSCAELGYFSAKNELAEKIALVLDAPRQKTGSFISLGPAKRIASVSRFQQSIQIDYENPDFSIISERIKEMAPLSKNRRNFSVAVFSKTTPFELFALIHQIVSLLGIATMEDVEFVLRSLYDSHISSSKSKKIASILVGSNRLIPVGEFGHLTLGDTKPSFLTLKDGAKTEFNVIRYEMAECFLSAGPDFQAIIGT